MTHEFDHLPGRSTDVWRELARRASVSGRYYRRRCRQLAFELDIAERRLKALDRENALSERRLKALDRENALLTAQVDVLRMALTAPRGSVPRASEEID